MNNYIKHIVEEFDFNAIVQNNNLSDMLLQSVHDSIFKKLIKNKCDTSCLTESEKKYFDFNVKLGYPFKYKTDTHRIKIIVQTASLTADEMKTYEVINKVDKIPVKDLNWLDVSNVQYFDRMFNSVYGKFDISKWDVSKGTSFYSMFSSAVIFADISNWNMSNALTLANMFAYSRVKVGDLSKWDTSKVRSLNRTFANSYYAIDGISEWNVSNVKDMAETFSNSHYNCDLSKWDVSNVRDMSALFCNSDFNNDSISEWNVSDVTDTVMMFASSDFDQDISKWNFKNLRNMNGMFQNSGFNHDISMWKLPKIKEMINVFQNCPIKNEFRPKCNVKESVDFDAVNIDNSENIVLKSYYDNLFDKLLHVYDFAYLSEEEKRMYTLNIENGCPYKYKVKDNEELQSIIDKFDNKTRKLYRVYDPYFLPLNLNWLDVSNVWDMSRLFLSTQIECDISDWDVSHVTRMFEMFAESSFSGDLSKWDISNVVDMTRMFYQSQFTGDLTNWDIRNVPEKDDMFTGCLLLFRKYPKM